MRAFRVLLTALLLVGLTFAGVPAQAQTTVPSTTLSSALTATNSQVIVASVGSGSTILQVGSYLFVDWEMILVQRCGTATSGACTSTTLNVMRGVNGTVAQSHLSGATVRYGVGTMFQVQDPPYGSCALTAIQYLPWINTRTGTNWMCDARGGSGFRWYGTNIAPIAYDSTPQFRGN